MLQVSFSSKDAKKALKTVIPSMESGININTTQGDFSLTGEDAERVMILVAHIAEMRAANKTAQAKIDTVEESLYGEVAYHFARSEYEIACLGPRKTGPLFGDLPKYEQAKWIAQSASSGVLPRMIPQQNALATEKV